MQLSESKISCMTSKAYKTHIKSKVTQYAFKYLTNEQQTHSKIKHIQYFKPEIQPYLKSPLFSNGDISTLFGLRSQTIRGIRNDFRELYKPNLSCPAPGLPARAPLLCHTPVQAAENVRICQNVCQPDRAWWHILCQTRHDDIFSARQGMMTYSLPTFSNKSKPRTRTHYS